MSARGRIVFTVAALTLCACRPDPGPNNYQSQEPFPHDGGAVLLAGPNPYVPGTRRLSVGAFYESMASDVIPVDNMTSNLYVYSMTVTLMPDSDHIEGLTSTRITHAGLTWWGLGINWMMTRDLSSWTKMHVSLRSKDATFGVVDIGLLNTNPVFLHSTDYGYAADDTWHSITIPLADFVAAGCDLTKIAAPFVLNGGPGMGGEELKVDDLYFTAD